jgi:hypothetical protein
MFEKSCKEKTCFIFSNIVSKIVQFMRMWNTIVEPGRAQMSILYEICILVNYATHTHTHTHAKYVTLTAFPLQKGCMNTP